MGAGAGFTARVEGRDQIFHQVAWATIWFCLLILFVALRARASHPIVNADELIPVKLSEAMVARGSLDPNWRLADLPDNFRVDQYNFYFYNVVAHGVIQLAGVLGRPALAALRHANLVFQLLALAFALDALRRIGASRLALVVAAALIALAPGMVQDAAMARPESLLYLLSALFVWTLTLPLAQRRRMLLAGAVLGAGIAVKLTFASLAVMLPFLLPRDERSGAALAAPIACLVLGAVAGFAAAAPFALIHPDVYLNGLALLAAQYGGAHPPHSLPAYSVAAQTAWIGSYFLALYGLVPLAALTAPVVLRGPARDLALAGVVSWLVLFGYFALKPVFFERNFAHALVPMLLAAALAVEVLPRPSWRAIAAGLIVLPAAYWSTQIASARGPERLWQFEAAHALAPTQRIFFGAAYAGEMPARCETVAVQDFGDPWSAAYLARLEAGGFKPVAVYRGRFSPVVTSTLQTYLDADMHYLRCP